METTDRKRTSWSIPSILGAVTLVFLIGSALGIMWMRVTDAEEAARRAELEARRQAEMARAVGAGREDRGPGAIKRTLPGLPGHDPLADLNQAFRDAYAEAREQLMAAAHPVVIVDGDDLVLRTEGPPRRATAVPKIYHEIKAIGHIPLALFLLTRGPDGLLTPQQLEALSNYAKKLEWLRRTDLPSTWPRHLLSRSNQIINESKTYLTQCIESKSISTEKRSAYARAMSGLVLESTEDAARAQIEGLHKQMMEWKKEVPPGEWARLRVIVMGSQTPRKDNVAVQYFAWLLGETGEGKRIVYSEGIFDEPKAMKLAGTRELDGEVAAAFFNDDQRLYRDLLGDAAKAVLKSKSQ